MDDLERRVRSTLRDSRRNVPAATNVRNRFWRDLEQPAKNGRFRLTAPAVSIAAVLVIVAAGVLVMRASDVGEDSGGTSVDVAESPRAAQGYRFEGRGSVVVEVPDQWSVEDYQCGVPMSDTVAFVESDGARLCQVADAPLVTDVRITAADSRAGSLWASMTTESGEVDGYEMRRGFPEMDDGLSAEIVVVPELDFAMFVRGPKSSLIEEIIASVQLLPAGYVAVPDVRGLGQDSAHDILMSVGLRPEVLPTDDPNHVAELVESSSPRPGLVVPDGETITLTVPMP